jgi:hypothetical protein
LYLNKVFLNSCAHNHLKEKATKAFNYLQRGEILNAFLKGKMTNPIQLVGWGDRLVSCTLILQIGLVLLGFGAVTDIVPRLTTVEIVAVTDVMWWCIRIWSVLLSVAELEVS